MTGRNAYLHLRSFLEVPILNPKYWSKARETTVDALMVDLEDSVHSSMKQQARARVNEVLQDKAALSGHQMAVRVNNLSTPWGREDLAMLAAATSDVIVCYPKAETKAELTEVVRIVRSVRQERGVWAMIESPRGVLDLREIAGAEGLVGLHFGYTDYAAEMALSPFSDGGEALAPAVALAGAQVAVAAAANNLFATGGTMVPDYKNLEKVERFVRAWSDLGYTGCLALSPLHLPVVARVFAPEGAAIDAARETCAAFETATASGEMTARLGERLITLPEYRRARQLLSRVRAS